MLRRSIMCLAAGMAFTTPSARALTPGRTYNMGWLGNTATNTGQDERLLAVIRERLRELGLVEGKNLVITWRFGEGRSERYNNFAAELVRLGVDVIFAPSFLSLAAAASATKSVPIVGMGDGFVELGYAKSLARPGGNITGVQFQSLEYASKHFELLYSIRPGLKRLGYSGNVESLYAKSLQSFASPFGVTLVPLPIMLNTADIEPLLEAAKREGVQALVIAGQKGFLFDAGFQRINQWAIENKVVTSSGNWQRGQVMITHGPIVDALMRTAISQVGQILGGASPADIPIEQPTRFEVLIDLRAAKAMNLTVPQSVLLQATELIQ